MMNRRGSAIAPVREEPRVAGTAAALLSGWRVELAGERGLLAGGGGPVQHATAHRVVERADGLVDGRLGLRGLGVDRDLGRLDRGADGAARRAVALTPL